MTRNQVALAAAAFVFCVGSPSFGEGARARGERERAYREAVDRLRQEKAPVRTRRVSRLPQAADAGSQHDGPPANSDLPDRREDARR